MAQEKCYPQVNHAGSQYVKAPMPANTPKGNGSVKTGTDLRSGK